MKKEIRPYYTNLELFELAFSCNTTEEVLEVAKALKSLNQEFNLDINLVFFERAAYRRIDQLYSKN